MAKKQTNSTKARDAKGRFLPGCSPGPGRPPAQREEVYLRTLRQAMPPDKFITLVEKVYKQAIGGSLRAAELLFKFVLPEPAKKHEVDAAFADTAGEYRVAGASRSQINEEVVGRIIHLSRQQRELEGLPPHPGLEQLAEAFSTNGNGHPDARS